MGGFWTGWGKVKPADAPVASTGFPIDQWEYLRIAVGEEPDMDALGAQGWELVVIAPEHYIEAATQRSLAPPSYVFKRKTRK